MRLSIELQRQIIDFLLTLPDLDDTKSQRAFIFSAGLDSPLKNRIQFGESSAQFVALLVSNLVAYGRLVDGRYALEAVLETAKTYVGQEKQAYCEILLDKLRTNATENFQRLSEQSKPRIISYQKFFMITVILFLILIITVYIITTTILSPMKGRTPFDQFSVTIKDQEDKRILPVEAVYYVQINQPVTIEILFSNPPKHKIDVKWTTKFGEISAFSTEQTIVSAQNVYILKGSQNDYIKVFLLDKISGKSLEYAISIQSLS